MLQNIISDYFTFLDLPLSETASCLLRQYLNFPIGILLLLANPEDSHVIQRDLLRTLGVPEDAD